MRTSIAVTNFSWSPRAPIPTDLVEVVQRADERGIDSVFVSDHLVQAEPGTDPHEPMLEAFTTLGFLAARTDRIRLGALVAAATMRPAALLIKAVTTLDVLSAGRAWFGIGAGYHQQEADDFGLPLPSTTERFEWLEDTLDLAHRMWAGDESSFAGRRLTATRPISAPAPVTRPRPPVLVGGTGEKKTLWLVAQYADACNLFDIPDGGTQIRHKLSVLAEHCAALDRPYDEISKTVSTRLSADETADAFVARAHTLAALGIDHLVVLTEGPWTTSRLAVLAEAADAIADTVTARHGR